MNKERRARLDALQTQIEEFKSRIESLVEEAQAVADEEEEAFGNRPESQQAGEAEEQRDACGELPSNLEDAVNALSEAFETCEKAKGAA